MKKWIFAIGSVALVGVVSISYVAKNSLDSSNVSLDSSQFDMDVGKLASIENPGSPNTGFAHNEAQDGVEDTFITDLIAKLQSTHVDDIHLLHIQASLIKVKEFVLKRYPHDGEEKFAEIINRAFPEYAANILSLLDKLALFNDWLLESQADLLAMAPNPTRNDLGEASGAFGEDAEKIWAHELSEVSQQKTVMQQVIQTLDQAHDISMDEKLYQLQTAISEQLEGTIQNEAMSGALVSKVFFTLGSVQQELASMKAEDRQEKINDIRGQLGLNEEQIQRLQARDQERENRWENGLAYMAEREQVLASVDEYSRSQALDELRERYFGRDALTIQREEEADFWRYKRRRVYGVN